MGSKTGVDCVGSRNGAGSGAVFVGSRNGAGSGADSVGSRNGAGSGADSVGSRNGAGSAANSTLKAEPLKRRARLTCSSSDSSGAQYGIMDLKGSARPPQKMTMRQVFSVADWQAIPMKSSA